MDLLNLFGGCSLLITAHCAPSQAPTPSGKIVARWQPMIAQAAATFALPQAWVSAVMARESGGKISLNGRPITSPAGAMGLMQVMPRTYDDMRKQLGLGLNPYAPQDNITAGAAYLQQMYRRYGYPGMFAAYNAGPGRFDDFLLRQRPLPSETLAYVAKIAPGAEIAFAVSANTARMPISHASGMPERAAADTLFVALNTRSALFVPLSAPRP
jgi:soluble lytic murein transglycosylase-like protein